MSAELETLDQLQGGELQLSNVATLFPSTGALRRAVIGLLSCGDVILKTIKDASYDAGSGRACLQRTSLRKSSSTN